MDDKAFWRGIIADAYRVPSARTLTELTDELNRVLGDTDPELRDEIAVEILTTWIIGGFYSPEALRALMHGWVANLEIGIGEQGTESVLLRSFSALMLSIIAYRDWKEPFLTAEEVNMLLSAALGYCRDEQDVRGHHAQMGWLHSPAHTADLLKFLARNPSVNADGLIQIIDAVVGKITALHPEVFNHSEPERLSWVILDVLKRDLLPEQAWEAWINKLGAVKHQDEGTEQRSYHVMYQNTKNFIRALYFIVAYQEQEEAFGQISYLREKLFHVQRLFQL